MTEHQERDHAVACWHHSPRHVVLTWNYSGECDACEAALAAAAVLVSSAGIEFAS